MCEKYATQANVISEGKTPSHWLRDMFYNFMAQNGQTGNNYASQQKAFIDGLFPNFTPENKNGMLEQLQEELRQPGNPDYQ